MLFESLSHCPSLVDVFLGLVLVGFIIIEVTWPAYPISFSMCRENRFCQDVCGFWNTLGNPQQPIPPPPEFYMDSLRQPRIRHDKRHFSESPHFSLLLLRRTLLWSRSRDDSSGEVRTALEKDMLTCLLSSFITFFL